MEAFSFALIWLWIKADPVLLMEPALDRMDGEMRTNNTVVIIHLHKRTDVPAGPV